MIDLDTIKTKYATGSDVADFPIGQISTDVLVLVAEVGRQQEELERLLRLEKACRPVQDLDIEADRDALMVPVFEIAVALEYLDQERALNTGKPLEEALKKQPAPATKPAVKMVYGCNPSEAV